MNPREPRTYAQWLVRLNVVLHRKLGLSLRDLADLEVDTREAFTEGVTVEEFFDDVVRHELEDLGFPFQDFEDAAFQEEVLAQLGAVGTDGEGSGR
jgi:hypothetical protein